MRAREKQRDQSDKSKFNPKLCLPEMKCFQNSNKTEERTKSEEKESENINQNKNGRLGVHENE